MPKKVFKEVHPGVFVTVQEVVEDRKVVRVEFILGINNNGLDPEKDNCIRYIELFNTEES